MAVIYGGNVIGTMSAGSNTTSGVTGTYDASNLKFGGAGIASVGYSNGSVIVSVPSGGGAGDGYNIIQGSGNTAGTMNSYASATFVIAGGNNITLSQSSNTMSIIGLAGLTTAALSNHSHDFATTTTNGSQIVVATENSSGVTLAVPPFITTYAAQSVQPAVGLNTAQTNVAWTVNSSGLSINAAGYAGTGTSATNASITLDSNGLAISVAAPGGGAGVTLSRWDPCSYSTGSSYSSHAPATTFFQHLENDEARAISYINVVKSFGAGVPAGTSSNVSQSFQWSYRHGITLFSRQNYGAQSTNLTTVASASWGASATFRHSSSSAQSMDLRWVTDSTGGTSAYQTNSNGNGWSAFVQGPRVVRVPFVTTLSPGEYWIAHGHSTTAASTGATATTIMQVSNFHVVPQLLNSNLMLMGIGTTSSSVGHLWPAAQGVASAVTTNNTMAMSAISNLTVQHWYWNAGNL